MNYQPIENYGLIGDMHTVALVGKNGSIDWLCLPHFDSPSVFASLLDRDQGGFFKITPKAPSTYTTKQFYWPETNVLVTRILSPEGVAEIIDFMVVSNRRQDKHQSRLYRLVRQVRGTMRFSLHILPAFHYGRNQHRVELATKGINFFSPQLNIRLRCGLAMRVDGLAGKVDFTLNGGQSSTFLLEEIPADEIDRNDPPNEDIARILFYKTIDYWRNWLNQCSYSGRWREMVYRSALTLKLLTFQPTGAIVAAPTCSLPEALGGDRNWDYRYTWIRDAAFTLYAFLRIGFTEEAEHFMQWIEQRCRELNPDGSLQIMYGIRGEHTLTEDILSHLQGYGNSSPVRIGNGAFNQLQLDIYGELMDSVYLYNKYGAPISYELWTHLRQLIDWVCRNWHKKDEGIWEVRSGQQHFVYSKLMCWVALDRGLRLADKRSFPCDRQNWLKVRDTIYEQIMQRGWSDKRQAFVQYYGSEYLDAANLMMPLVFFVSPNDPRLVKTLDAMLESPEKGGLVSDSLVYRYNVNESSDGLSGHEGTFNICTFWMVEALTRLGRTDHKRLEQARLMFEQMQGYANHLGLYSEETGSCGEALGNFPQAFTHLALISAAYNLDKALGGRKKS